MNKDLILTEDWQPSEWYINALGNSERVWMRIIRPFSVIEFQTRDERDVPTSHTHSFYIEAIIASLGKFIASSTDSYTDTFMTGILNELLTAYAKKGKLVFHETDCDDTVYNFDKVVIEKDEIVVKMLMHSDPHKQTSQPTNLFNEKSLKFSDIGARLLEELNLSSANEDVILDVLLLLAAELCKLFDSRYTIKQIMHILINNIPSTYRIPANIPPALINSRCRDLTGITGMPIYDLIKHKASDWKYDVSDILQNRR